MVQFDQMAVIPSELRMLEQSNQHPHIILFIIIIIVIFNTPIYYFYVSLLNSVS